MVDYDEYLKSNRWERLRAWVLIFWDHRCAICGSEINLHVHHRTYDRLGKELLTDLIVLCKECHELYHSRLAAFAGRNEVPNNIELGR